MIPQLIRTAVPACAVGRDTRNPLALLPQLRTPSAASLSCAAALLALTAGFPQLLPAESIRNQNVDGANTVGPFSFGQSVTTPTGGPWTNIRFNFVINESGQLFDPNGTGAIGTLFLLSQSYTGPAAALSNATPGFLASTSTIDGGVWQFASDVILQPETQYFFYMPSALGPTQVLWRNLNNPLAGGESFQAFSGQNYSAQPNFDQVFALQGDVAGVPEPRSVTLTAAGLALGILGALRRRSRSVVNFKNYLKQGASQWDL